MPSFMARCSSARTGLGGVEARRYSEAAAPMQLRGSPIGQSELDPAVLAVSVLGVAGIDGLEFGESGGDQSLRRNPLLDQVFDHGRGACARQFPIGLELRSTDGPLVRVPVDP